MSFIFTDKVAITGWLNNLNASSQQSGGHSNIYQSVREAVSLVETADDSYDSAFATSILESIHCVVDAKMILFKSTCSTQ